MDFVCSFKDDAATLEILGDYNDQTDYNVEFIDLNTNNIEYSSVIKVNHWSKINSISDKNILIKVKIGDVVVFERRQDEKFNRVFIMFGSEALGDSIAWIPYVEEYRVTNNVDVILYSKFNFLFDKVYPDIIYTDNINISNVDKKFRIDYGPELYRIDGVSASEQIGRASCRERV